MFPLSPPSQPQVLSHTFPSQVREIEASESDEPVTVLYRATVRTSKEEQFMQWVKEVVKLAHSMPGVRGGRKGCRIWRSLTLRRMY